MQRPDLPMMPLFPLGHVMHCTVDRMHEDLLELQTSCCSASDSDRRKKIILYCEVQRHRALQLLALHYFAENESQVVETAVQGIGSELGVQWTKNAAAWNHEYATPDMRPYAAWEAVRLFKSVRAPKYDIKTAVNVLVNGEYDGLDLLEKNLLQTEEHEVKSEDLQDRVLSRILSSEFRDTTEFPATMPVDGQITCQQANAYSVRLTLDEESRWYCTNLKLFVGQPESEEKITFSSKWGIALAAQLEEYIFKQQATASVFESTHRFMTTFCGSFALQILEKQAENMKLSIADSSVECLKCNLAIPGWVLSITIEDNGKRFACRVENAETSKFHKLEVQISLRCISLATVIESAMFEVARYKLEHLRDQVLQLTVRHDSSQCRIVKSAQFGYQLDFDLFDDSTVLTAALQNGAFHFTTNSKAIRWGQFTVGEFLHVRAKEVAVSLEQGQIVLALWNEAEAWDALSLLHNMIQGVHSSPSYVSPSFELVPHISMLPSLFWPLGSFEGLKYVLVCQFQQSPSLFHLKFQPKAKRILKSVECMLCSIGRDEGGEVRVLDLKKEPLETLVQDGTDAIAPLVLSMREQWVKKLFQSRFQLSISTNSTWQGSSLSHIQAFEPYKFEFSDEGLRITCNSTASNSSSAAAPLLLKPTDQADVVFDQQLRNMVLIDRLAVRCATLGTVIRGHNQLVLQWPPPQTGAVRFSIHEETLNLQAFCVPTPHPLEDKIAQFCELHPSDTSLDLALSMLSDSIKAVQAAEAFAKRTNRFIRVSASNVTNVHFMFDATAAGEERLSFDCRFYGSQRVLVWNRAGWSHTSAMMRGDIASLTALQEVLNA